MEHNILWLDDRQRTHSAFSFLLERYGNRVTNIDNVDDALNALASGSFEFLITDVMMPHGDRFDSKTTQNDLITGVVISLYVRLYFPHIPILVLSAGSGHVRYEASLEKMGIMVAPKMVGGGTKRFFKLFEAALAFPRPEPEALTLLRPTAIFNSKNSISQFSAKCVSLLA